MGLALALSFAVLVWLAPADGLSDMGPDCEASGTPDEGCCCPDIPPGDIWAIENVVAPASASVNNNEWVFMDLSPF